MALDNFDRALIAVLRHEGGYVNHPADPGGATNKGVTQVVYDGFRNRLGLPKRSVRHITETEVRDIYKRQYWEAVKGDELPAGIDYMVFDGAVNSGPSRSGRWLQSALGVKVDGVIGEATLNAARQHPNHDVLIARACRIRMGFLRGLRTWPTFGRGWTSRVAGVNKMAQAMATGETATIPMKSEPGAQAKATASDIDRPTEKQEAAADALTGAGGAGSIISGAAQQLEPVKESSPVILYIFIGLTVLSVLLLAGGFALRWYNSRKAARAKKAMDSEAVAEVEAV